MTKTKIALIAALVGRHVFCRVCAGLRPESEHALSALRRPRRARA